MTMDLTRFWNERMGNFFFGTSLKHVPRLIPGVALAAGLAWVSVFPAKFIGESILGLEKSPVSSVMVAILLGMLVGNLIVLSGIFKPGFAFAVKKLLRLGIMLLGFRLSFSEALRYGLTGIPVIVACIGAAFGMSMAIAKTLKLSPKLGALIAVGTSICGVSAIVAVGPSIEANEEEISYSVAIITVFGIIATLLYPYIAHLAFNGSVSKVGMFLGTAIHDTSQVTGAALVYEQMYPGSGVLGVAAVTKLVRNIFMVIVIPLAAFFHGRKTRSLGTAVKRPSIATLVPLFIAGFLFFSLIRTAGDAGIGSGAVFGIWEPATWKAMHTTAGDLGYNLIGTSLAAVGLTTSFKLVKGMGFKPFLAGLGASAIVGIVSFLLIGLLY